MLYISLCVLLGTAAAPPQDRPEIAALLPLLDTPGREAGRAKEKIYRMLTDNDLSTVCRLLDDHRIERRLAGFYYCGRRWGNPAPLVPLFLKAMQDEDPLIRRAAAWRAGGIIWRTGSEPLLKQLIAALDDPDRTGDHRAMRVAEVAARGLADSTPTDLRVLLALWRISAHRDADIRRFGLYGIVDHARRTPVLIPVVYPYLLCLMHDQQRPDYRYFAAASLGRFPVMSWLSVPLLAKALKEKTGTPQFRRDFRRSIIWVLDEFGPASAPALPELMAVAEDFADRENCHSAVLAIEKIGKKAVPYIARLRVLEQQLAVQPEYGPMSQFSLVCRRAIATLTAIP